MSAGDWAMNIAMSEFVGKMRKGASPGDWRQYNDSFNNAVMPTEDFAVAMLQGKNFTTPHHHRRHHIGWYDDGTMKMSSYRHHRNWMPTHVLAIDIDKPWMPMSAFAERWRDWVTVAYETMSSTEEEPRYRVLTVLDQPIRRIENHATALAALMVAWAGNGVDVTSKDTVKAYAGTRRQARIICDPSVVVPIGRIQEMVDLYRREREEVAEEARRLAAEGRPPEADEIAEMLRYMPVKMDYIDWFKCIGAVHNAGLPKEVAVQLIEAWSPGYPGEVAYKYDTIREGFVSIAWLISAAKRRGYQRPQTSRVAASRFMMGVANGSSRSRRRSN